jgi:dCMP deaminase
VSYTDISVAATNLSCPCLRCAVKIVQTGVKEVVYELEYSMDDRSREIFGEAGVTFRKYAPQI